MVRPCVEGRGVFRVDSFCAHDFAFGWFYIGGFRVDVPFFDISHGGGLPCQIAEMVVC
jgi:hypothetical protein